MRGQRVDTYSEMMDHVAVQHAHSREGDLVAHDHEVALPAIKSEAVPVRRVNQIEVLSFAVSDRVLNILPAETTPALADHPHLVVVLVERVGGVDLGAVLDDEVDHGSVLQETVRVTPRRLTARNLVPHDGRCILPEELMRSSIEYPRRGPCFIHHELEAEVGLLGWLSRGIWCKLRLIHDFVRGIDDAAVEVKPWLCVWDCAVRLRGKVLHICQLGMSSYKMEVRIPSMLDNVGCLLPG